MASRLRKAVGLEARAREQSSVPNAGGCVLLTENFSKERRLRQSSILQTRRLESRRSLVICPALAAIGFLPHPLRVAFAGKEESPGAYPRDSIGR